MRKILGNPYKILRQIKEESGKQILQFHKNLSVIRDLRWDGSGFKQIGMKNDRDLRIICSKFEYLRKN